MKKLIKIFKAFPLNSNVLTWMLICLVLSETNQMLNKMWLSLAWETLSMITAFIIVCAWIMNYFNDDQDSSIK